jgi:hypothetical protein
VAASLVGAPLAALWSVEFLRERPPAPSDAPCSGELGADSPMLGVKYWARPFSRSLSGLETSQSSMKNAIIAVTKSA